MGAGREKASSRFFVFVFSIFELSQFSGPDYHGAWNRLRIFWCNSSTTRPHTWVVPVNTMRNSHNHTLSRHWWDYPQPRIIFSRLTQGKYHQITRQNVAYLHINTSGPFSCTRLIQVPGCRVTRLADQCRPCFHTRSIGLGQRSPAILLAPN